MKTFQEMAEHLNKMTQEQQMDDEQKTETATALKHQGVTIRDGVVTNVMDSGSAFAKCMETGYDIFIPKYLGNIIKPRMGDVVTLGTVPNRAYEDWRPSTPGNKPAPLFAIYTPKNDDAVEPPQAAVEPHVDVVGGDGAADEDDLRTGIMRALVDGPKTSAQIDKMMPSHHPYKISYALTKMHATGEVARASIERIADASKASFVYWGLSADHIRRAIEKKCK